MFKIPGKNTWYLVKSLKTKPGNRVNGEKQFSATFKDSFRCTFFAYALPEAPIRFDVTFMEAIFPRELFPRFNSFSAKVVNYLLVFLTKLKEARCLATRRLYHILNEHSIKRMEYHRRTDHEMIRKQVSNISLHFVCQ